jgi:3-deoxy-D-manno-octulosonic acid kinase
MIFLTAINSIKIGSDIKLSEKQLNELYGFFINTFRARTKSDLRGRGVVNKAILTDLGDVVIKCYRRGGFFGNFVSQYYVASGLKRSELEFNILNKVRELGINAPKPIAFAYQGTGIYKAWLVTKLIADSKNLADLSLIDKDRAVEITSKLSEALILLIKNRIFHVDLHPGNVLVKDSDELYILDFDKASSFSGSTLVLRNKYLRRWRRAVIKHKLPEALSEVMCFKLLKSNL